MHPAYSVIFFTTATGAGYGLLALLVLAAITGAVPPDFWLGLVGLGLALGLVSAGLLSSTGHLGRPERAWRAFSQWRTSWLSREGVAAAATYVPAGLFAIGWVFLHRVDGWFALAGVLAVIGAVVTTCTTAMIYASLKPVAEWHTRYTLPSYLILAAMSGAVLLIALLGAFGLDFPALTVFALVATLLGWAWKRLVWRENDRLAMPATLNSATGLADGSVRSVEWPHTEANYLLKEMGFRIGRKHAAKLRLIAQATAFLVPALLLALSLAVGGPVGLVAALAAAPVQLGGLLVERWLFFAEARHTVRLYYGV